jgi:hypothetical protein
VGSEKKDATAEALGFAKEGLAFFIAGDTKNCESRIFQCTGHAEGTSGSWLLHFSG